MNKLFSFLFGKKTEPPPSKPLLQTAALTISNTEKLENLIIILAAKRANGEYMEAIQTYERYSGLISGSEVELPALTSIIRIADEAKDTTSLEKYARKLKVIEPEHPYVDALSKRFIL